MEEQETEDLKSQIPDKPVEITLDAPDLLLKRKFV